MSELSPDDLKMPQPQARGFTADRLPVTLPPAVLAQRRRSVRWIALATFVTATHDGATTNVHEFTYGRRYGAPFTVVKTNLGPAGEIDRLSIEGEGALGILGNFAVALVGVLGLFAAVARRRRAH
jgi:hypothetical protein